MSKLREKDVPNQSKPGPTVESARKSWTHSRGKDLCYTEIPHSSHAEKHTFSRNGSSLYLRYTKEAMLSYNARLHLHLKINT